MLVDSRITLTAVWRVVTGLQSGHQNLFSSPALFLIIIVLKSLGISTEYNGAQHRQHQNKTILG